ncbi:hypothetical protein V5O48_011297 [Marasmius crinis-equi]|uniref:Retrotransposon gag domain-containing protein n=1 Tax=Marasmius crinis-equi TaxID=585013 RepID=A0ABR3F602_9AGAR
MGNQAKAKKEKEEIMMKNNPAALQAVVENSLMKMVLADLPPEAAVEVVLPASARWYPKDPVGRKSVATGKGSLFQTTSRFGLVCKPKPDWTRLLATLGGGGHGGDGGDGGNGGDGRDGGGGGRGGGGGSSSSSNDGDSDDSDDSKIIIANIVEAMARIATTQESKLSPWLTEILLQFNYCPKNYSTDPDKINYALSYLWSDALEVFQADLLNPIPEADPPVWMVSFAAFIEELEGFFGAADDNVNDAEDKLDLLCMRNTDRINKYEVKFNKLAVKVGYGENTLHHAFYRGLPQRIKDLFLGTGRKPKTCAALCARARKLDRSYWQHEAEKSCKARAWTSAGNSSNNSKSSQSKSSTSSTSQSNPQSSSSSSNQNRSNNSKNQNQSNNRSSGFSSGSPNLLANILGPNGKLKPSELECCKKNNLCVFCSGKHTVAQKIVRMFGYP